VNEAERERIKRRAAILDRTATICQKGSFGVLLLTAFWRDWPAGIAAWQIFMSFALYQLASLVLYDASQRILRAVEE
jgi:hypothetical protein